MKNLYKPTHAEVYDWAKEAGGSDWSIFRDFMPEIETLARLAYEAGRKDENEACADMVLTLTCMGNAKECFEVAATYIRARREQ